MFKSNPNSETSVTGVTIPTNVWNVIQQQAESLAARDRQTDELIGMLKSQIADLKKEVARADGAVTSAVAG